MNATEVIEGRERWCVEHGDALEVLKKLPSSSLDAWVNDPPSGIAFMGRDWDKDKGGAEAWIAWFEELSREVFRVLKPGAHGFVWSLPRTSHWTGTALERAGFEIRDQLHHVFGSGFPKSLNVGRDIVERCEERYGCGSSCTCELDPRVGRAARNDVGRQRREDHRIHVESGSRSQEEARDPNLPIDARRDRSGVRDVWPGDSAQEQRPAAVEEAVLLESVRQLGSEEARQRGAEVRPGLEETASRDSSARQGLPSLREDAGTERVSATRAPHQAVPDRGHESPRQPCGSLRDVPPPHRGGDHAGARLDPDRREPRRLIADDLLGWSGGFSAFVCSWCERPDRAWLDSVSVLGTALKPAHEIWWLVRKPLDGTVAANVQEHGTGALNIDGCRVAGIKDVPASPSAAGEGYRFRAEGNNGGGSNPHIGRWPANFALTHSASCRKVGTAEVKANPTWDTPNRETESTFTGETVSKVRHGDGDTETVDVFECDPSCPVRLLDEQSGETHTHAGRVTREMSPLGYGDANRSGSERTIKADSGGASRFFHCFELTELDDLTPFLYMAKPSRSERDKGLEHWETAGGGGAKNVHPTVKGIEFMRFLCRLITPPGGIVLDQTAGSGSTGVAAVLEGFRFIGIELNDTPEEPFASIARARIQHVLGGRFEVPEAAPLRPKKDVKQRSLFE